MKKIEAAYIAFLEEEKNKEIVPVTVKSLLEEIADEEKTLSEGSASVGLK